MRRPGVRIDQRAGGSVVGWAGREIQNKVGQRRELEVMRSVENRNTVKGGGLTIIELLVVLAIIGLLSVLSLPMMKGIGRSNVMASATRQLMDDLALARHKAMVGRTTVHVIFVPEASALDPSYATLLYNPDYNLYL